MNIAQANEEFGIRGVLSIRDGAGGLPLIEVQNPYATAQISAYGGQVLAYRPSDEPDDLLFVSRKACFQRGKAIKGGIPVCWPWFGDDPLGRGRSAHGFARNRSWRLLATEAMADGATRLQLGLHADDETLALWPYAFSLTLDVTIGATLDLALISHNPGDQPLVLTQALHTYFNVGDATRAQVHGLDGRAYIDKAGGGVRGTQQGPVTVGGEVDRIYLDTDGPLLIDDPVLGRQIHIERGGSRSAVVWNPWIEKAEAMSDFGDDEYRRMLCVETTNAADDRIELPAGGTYRLTTRYRIERR
jgi:glucose-6-phosphate 1-epimerase